MASTPLTRNQREILKDLVRLAGGPERNRWIPLTSIRARSTSLKLVDKGMAEVIRTYGPRGGEHLWFRPSDAGYRRSRLWLPRSG
jgi:hypothetical protein